MTMLPSGTPAVKPLMAAGGEGCVPCEGACLLADSGQISEVKVEPASGPEDPAA
jgi:hypothetical protein